MRLRRSEASAHGVGRGENGEESAEKGSEEDFPDAAARGDDGKRWRVGGKKFWTGGESFFAAPDREMHGPRGGPCLSAEIRSDVEGSLAEDKPRMSRGFAASKVEPRCSASCNLVGLRGGITGDVSFTDER
jgi:hypothetical protein